jgi:hypothetical protein
MKSVWFALAQSRSEIGYTMEAPVEERQSYRNWAKRRGQTLLGEYTSRKSARQAVDRWLSAQVAALSETQSQAGRAHLCLCRQWQYRAHLRSVREDRLTMSSAETELCLYSPEPSTRRGLEGVGLSIRKQAEKRGWYASARWIDGGITIRLRNHDEHLLAELVQAFVRCAAKEGWTLTIVEKSVPSEPKQVGRTESGQIQWGALIHEKLSRKLLNSLPEGAFVVSSCFAHSKSIFAERVPGMRYRSGLWQKAKDVGAAGRTCSVLWSEQDFDSYRYLRG